MKQHTNPSEAGMHTVAADESEPRHKDHSRFSPHMLQQEVGWLNYGLALLIVAVLGITYLAFHARYPWFGYQSIGLIGLFAVLLIAVYLGRGPAIAAATASALMWNYLFISPRFTFSVASAADAVLLLLYFVIAILVGTLASRLREREREARHSAERTRALYTLANETATAGSLAEVLATAVDQIAQVFGASVAILLADNGRLSSRVHPSSTLDVRAGDYLAALWTFEKGQHSGQFTSERPDVSARFLPLRTPTRTVGGAPGA